MLRFVPNKPALMARGMLILADSHVGLEHAMFKKGIRIGSVMRSMSSDILSLAEEYKPKRIVILGDVKHSIPGAEGERKDVHEFLKALGARAPVTVVSGNHDGNLSPAARGLDIQIAPPRGAVIKGMGFFHGHAWPYPEVVEQPTVFMAHQHPCVEIFESIGARHMMRVWCVGAFSKRIKARYPSANTRSRVIIVPAFNPLLGGTALNSGSRLLGPIMKNKMFKLEQSKVYLLSGTPLGGVSDLGVLNDKEGLHGKEKRKRSDFDLRGMRKKGQEKQVR